MAWVVISVCAILVKDEVHIIHIDGWCTTGLGWLLHAEHILFD
jgi:hypothetical protein